MINLQKFMTLINYRITEGDSYGWQCFGAHAHQLSSWNGVHGTGGWSANIVFDTQDQTVYEVYICDYTRDRAYRIINPDFRAQYNDESDERGEQRVAEAAKRGERRPSSRRVCRARQAASC